MSGKNKIWGVVICLIAGLCILSAVTTHSIERDITSTAIYSMNRSSEVEGSFTLGCGSVETTQSYFYYEAIGIDSYQLRSVPTNRTTIVEVDTPPYSVIIDIPVETYKFWWLIPVRFPNTTLPRITVLVPRGTIIQSFNL